MEKSQTVKLNNLRMAPRKVRLVVSAIRGMNVHEAEAFLALNPKRATNPILKLLRSAVVSAKETKNMDVDKLIIKEARVDGGPMLKRFMPRAQGRATEIQKKTSHVTLIITESDKSKKSRFNYAAAKKKVIAAKEKEGKSGKEIEKSKVIVKEKPEKEKIVKAKKEKAFTTKTRQRKAI